MNYWFHDDLIVLLRNIFETNYKNNGHVGDRKTNRACILGVFECSTYALERLLMLIDMPDYDAHSDIYCNGLRVANEMIFWHFFNVMENYKD